MQVIGKIMQVIGKIMQVLGKIMQVIGKIMQVIGKIMRNAQGKLTTRMDKQVSDWISLYMND